MSDDIEVVEGEVIEEFDYEQARALTDEIAGALTFAHGLLIAAWRHRAWAALKYESWDAYCEAEFSSVRMVRLDRQQRRELVAEMRKAEMSTRAIGSALGVSNSTVHEDMDSGVRNRTPAEPITGTDGKTYRAHGGSTKRAAPPDVATVALELFDLADRAATLADRLTSQRLGRCRDSLPGWSRRLAASITHLEDLLGRMKEQKSDK